MKVEIDFFVFLVSALFSIPGFVLIWYNSNFFVALGVLLVGIGLSVRKTKGD